ncbi:MAG: OmpA family protein [Gemmatimonadota bacterium]|nr:OmpA family protein [Gemmatimonadota bacterium]
MRQVRFVFAATLAATALSACATKGFVRKNIEEQRVAMSGQLTNERGERVGADNSIRSDLTKTNADVAKVAADLAALRTELQSLRTEFGAKITAMEGQVTFAFPVHFDFNNANVRPVDQAALDKFATVAAKYYNGAQITVEGFADPAGSASYNLKLSKHRADAVRAYIAGRGIDSTMVKTVGYGKTRLVKKGAKRDDAGADLNRRVTFVIDAPSSATAATVAALSVPNQ